MDMLALILSIIGCLNWGLLGIFRFDLVAWIFGSQAAILSRIISLSIVGLVGRYPANCLMLRIAIPYR